MAKNRAKHVVVDTVAFFKNIQLQDIAENVYTSPGVVNEIRDRATRQRLAVLPYDLKYQDPSPESLKIISDFAKKTGDYRSLSVVDLKVLALTYQLTKEHYGTEHLTLAPEKKVTLTSSTRPLVKATEIVGFYLPPKDADSKTNKDEESASQGTDSTQLSEPQELGGVELSLQGLEVRQEDSDEQARGEEDERVIDEDIGAPQPVSGEVEVDDSAPKMQDDAEGPASAESDATTPSEMADVPSSSGEARDIEEEEEEVDEGDKRNCEEEEEAGEEDAGEEEEEAEEEEGWITPDNINRLRQGSGPNMETAEGVTVGCMTADFAMQNVLIQIGIPILSVEGMLIKRAKSFVLRCRSCFKITNNMTKVFCPHCGNKTLDKVTVTTEEDGNQYIHLSNRRVINKRGLKYPLPLPKGGKHSDNPILCEDQPVPHNRLSRKAQATTDVFNTDFIVGTSPFAIKDTTSKSAQLGVRSFVSNAAHHRRNPNQVRPKRGRKK